MAQPCLRERLHALLPPWWPQLQDRQTSDGEGVSAPELLAAQRQLMRTQGERLGQRGCAGEPDGMPAPPRRRPGSDSEAPMQVMEAFSRLQPEPERPWTALGAAPRPEEQSRAGNRALQPASPTRSTAVPATSTTTAGLTLGKLTGQRRSTRSDDAALQPELTSSANRSLRQASTLPSISLALASDSVAEDGEANLVYTVTRSGPTSSPLKVSYTIAGTATPGRDYSGVAATGATRSLSFAAGAASASVILNPTADTLVEADESVSLSLVAASTYAIATTTAVVGTIRNDDLPAISLALTPATVTEDGSTELIYSFSRNGPVSSPLTIRFNVSGSASFNDDYSQNGADSFSSSSGSLSFASGSATASLRLDPRADTMAEAHESVSLSLIADGTYRIAGSSSATGTIRNDDRPLITLALASDSVAEDGEANLVYTVTRSGPTSSPLKVRYTIAGTATPGRDYSGVAATGASRSLSFAAGAASASVILNPTADTLVEADESVSLSLVAASTYAIATTTAVVGTIRNDDFIYTAGERTINGVNLGSTPLGYAIRRNNQAPIQIRLADGQPASASNPGNGMAPIAATAVDNGYQLYWRNSVTNQDVRWDLDDQGVRSGEINLDNQQLLDAESALNTDLNNDGTVGSINPDAVSRSTRVSAAITDRGEVDRYLIDTITGAILSASLTSDSSTLFPLIDLIGPDGTKLKGSIAFNGSSADLGMVDLTTGKASLHVSTQAGGTGTYVLQIAIHSRDDLKREVIRLTNIERTGAGLQPLSYNALLEQAAEDHVQDMDRQDRYLAHTGSNGSDPEARIRATGYKAAWVNLGHGSLRTIRLENAAWGQTSPAQVVEAWMNSPGHRAAIMDEATREIGVGFDYDAQTGQTYWIQNFGYPMAAGLTPWF